MSGGMREGVGLDRMVRGKWRRGLGGMGMRKKKAEEDTRNSDRRREGVKAEGLLRRLQRWLELTSFNCGITFVM